MPDPVPGERFAWPPQLVALSGAAVHACLAVALSWPASASAPPDDSLTLPDLIVEDASTVDADSGALTINTGAYRARAIELAELLDQYAGLQVRRTGGFGSFTTVSIRGASTQQTDVRLNGLPLAPSVVGGFNFGTLSLKDLSAVDLHAGQAPVEFAQATPGGVINLRTELGESGWGQSGYASYGSAATWQAGVRSGARTGPVAHGLSLGAAASANDFTFVNPNRAFDPDDPNRNQEEPRRNADVDRRHGLYLGEWRISRDRILDALAQHSVQTQGLPDARNSASARTRLTSRQTNLQLRLRGSQGTNNRWSTRGFWHRTRLDYDDREDQLGVGAQLTHSEQQQYGGALGYHRGFGPRWRWDAQLEYARETYAATDLLSGRTSAGRRDHANLASRLGWTSPSSRWIAGLTLRHQHAEDRYDAGGERREDDLDATRPQLDLRWQPGESLQLHAQGGGYVRLPTFFERYGDRGLFIGNPALQPERGRNLNLGLRWRQPGWSLHAEGYASDLDDAIVTQYDVLSGIGRAENVAGARVLGVELGSRWSGTLGWLGMTMQARAALQDTENTSDGVLHGKQLPGRFTEKTFVGTTLWLPGRLELFHEWVYVGGVFYDSLNSRPAPDRHEHGIGLRKAFSLPGSTLDAGFEVRNLTDERLEDFNAQPHPGRQFFASVEWTLDPHTTTGSPP